MREILFRGKNTDGEWIEGFVGAVFTADENRKPILRNFTEIDCIGWVSHAYVYDETVGQYTGLTDEDGKKIFEGDIIKNIWTGDIHTVNWCVDCAVWVLPCVTDERRETTFSSYSGDDYMIIGNIYDNPELLKGGVSE